MSRLPENASPSQPDFPWSDLSNITFVNSSFLNNAGGAFQLSLSAIRPWNRTHWGGYTCGHEPPTAGMGPACPISVLLDRCVIDGGGCAVVNGTATSGCTHGEGPASGLGWDGISENYGVAVAGAHVDGPRGSFVVRDSVIANTALSGLMVSEKASSAFRVSLQNVELVHTALNDTDCECCITQLPF